MMIPIKRITLSGTFYEMLINTRYIIEISPANDDTKPSTRIIMDQLRNDDPKIIYTEESIRSIKAKITRISKRNEEE